MGIIAAITEPVWIAIVGGIVTLVGTWMSLKLRAIAKTGEAVHTLVNSNMGVQLKLNAMVTRRLSNLTLDPIDNAAAELAEKLYVEHEAKQDVLDRLD